MRRNVLFLLFLTIPLFAAKVDTLFIHSTRMDTTLGTIVISPTPLPKDTTSRFPVVYLLHGWSGNYTNWPSKTDLGIYADEFRIIIVCPDGGYAGWYLDSPVNPRSQYESFIVNDVVPLIDQRYPTRASARFRAITGLSMGGHGALYLFIRHPDVFGAAGSMSGVLELDQSTARYSIAQLLGDYPTHAERWREHSVLTLVEQLTGDSRPLLIDCGVADRFITANRKVHAKLLTLEYPHTYIERPGGHTWDYWISALPYHLLFFHQYFETVK